MMVTPIIVDPVHLMRHSSPSATVSTDTSIQQDQISNSYHGSFIISMVYLFHSNCWLFFLRKWIILLVKLIFFKNFKSGTIYIQT